MSFKAGYKFKETHSDIHFVRKSHGVAGGDYSENFTRDAEEARLFSTDKDAEHCIMELMRNVKRDNDYRWTPVICNQTTNTNRMILSSRWH